MRNVYKKYLIVNNNLVSKFLTRYKHDCYDIIRYDLLKYQFCRKKLNYISLQHSVKITRLC